jgi:hypothetical protein
MSSSAILHLRPSQSSPGFSTPRSNDDDDGSFDYFSDSPLLGSHDYSSTATSSALGLSSHYVPPTGAAPLRLRCGSGLVSGLVGGYRGGFTGGLGPLPSSLPSATPASHAPGLAAAFRATPATTAPRWASPAQSSLAPEIVRHLDLLPSPTRDAIAALLSAALAEREKVQSGRAEGGAASVVPALTTTPVDAAGAAPRSAFSQLSAAGSRTEGAPGAALFVCNLPPNTNEFALLELFAPFGMVVSARVAVDKPTGALKSYGFVYFAEVGAAENARRALNGRVMPTGHTLKVETKAAHGGSIFVANLLPGTDDALLSDLFAPYGAIVSAAIGVDKVTGTPRSHGFVNFHDAAAATKAIDALDGLLLANGKRLKVQLSTHRHAEAGGAGTGGGAKGAAPGAEPHASGGSGRHPVSEPFYAGCGAVRA